MAELRVDGLLSWGDAMLHFLLPPNSSSSSNTNNTNNNKQQRWKDPTQAPCITTLQLDLLPRNLDARKLNRLAKAVQKSHCSTITTVKFHIPQVYQEHDYQGDDHDQNDEEDNPYDNSDHHQQQHLWTTEWCHNNHNRSSSSADNGVEEFYFTDAVYYLFGELGRLPTLQVLKIGCCKDTNSNIVAARAMDVGALGAALKEAKGLQRLEMQQIILDGTDGSFAGLCNAVQHHSSLASVSLLDCYLSTSEDEDGTEARYNDNQKRSKMEQLLFAFARCRMLQELEVTNPGGDASALGRFWTVECFRRLCSSQCRLVKLVINGFEGLELLDCCTSNNSRDDTDDPARDNSNRAASMQFCYNNGDDRGEVPCEGLATTTTCSPFLAMTRGLENNCCLKELAVSCTLGEADFRALVHLLRGKDQSLEELTLNFYAAAHDSVLPTTDEVNFQYLLHKSILEVAEALKDNTQLKCLALRGIGDPTRYGMVTKLLRAFADMLAVNYSLEKLCWSYRCPPPLSATSSNWISEFYDNKSVDEDGMLYSQILHRLKLNQNGRGRLLRTESASREEWVEALVNVADDVSCLCDFLSLNPSLCVVSHCGFPVVTDENRKHQLATVVSDDSLCRLAESGADGSCSLLGALDDSRSEGEPVLKKRRIK